MILGLLLPRFSPSVSALPSLSLSTPDAAPLILPLALPALDSPLSPPIQFVIFPHLDSSSAPPLRRSHSPLYRSYPSRNVGLTRVLKMSSPRGFDAGGRGSRAWRTGEPGGGDRSPLEDRDEVDEWDELDDARRDRGAGWLEERPGRDVVMGAGRKREKREKREGRLRVLR